MTGPRIDINTNPNTNPASPPLDSRHLIIIKEHPIPSNVLAAMRKDMAARKMNAGPNMSDLEVLTRIVSIAGLERQDGDEAEASAAEKVDGQKEVEAVKSFVKAILSFLSSTDAAKKLDFEVYIPIPEKKEDQVSVGGEDTSEKVDGAVVKNQGENILLSQAGEAMVDSNSGATTLPAGITFSEALDLVIPLWPSVSPPSATVPAPAETYLALKKQEMEYVLRLTTIILLHVMGENSVPLGYQNDKQIWQSVSNLLHLYLSPPMASPTSSFNSELIRQQAKAHFTLLSSRLRTYAEEHPYRLGAQVALGVVGFFPGLVLGPVLGALGFGASGVVGGSIAAGWQASFAAGSPVVGSLFSMCQSFAMGGGLGGALTAGVSAIAGTFGAGLGAITKKKGTDGGTDEGESKQESTGEEGVGGDKNEK